MSIMLWAILYQFAGEKSLIKHKLIYFLKVRHYVAQSPLFHLSALLSGYRFITMSSLKSWEQLCDPECLSISCIPDFVYVGLADLMG